MIYCTGESLRDRNKIDCKDLRFELKNKMKGEAATD